MLKAYDAIRRPRANTVLEGSIRQGVMYDSFGPDHYSAEDMRRLLPGTREYVWLHDLEADVTKAIESIGGSFAIQT